MSSFLASHQLPRLEVRGPDTTGPLFDLEAIDRFRDGLVEPSGVSEPTTLAINLEGRFPSPGVLVDLILPLARAVKGGMYGPLNVVVCTQDQAVQNIIGALASAEDLRIFIAPSRRELDLAEPVGRLTATEKETLDIVNGLGGRATVAMFSTATGLEPNAATNRLVALLNKGFVQRVQRPGRQGQLFLDPRIAAEEVDDPTSGDYRVPEAVRRDVRALTEMQVREPGQFLANAWQEFLESHTDYLATEHARLTDLVKRGDREGLAQAGRRYAKKQAQSRRPRPERA